ncbi:MAG: GNAT family N-acetyltransferase [Bacillota bacterium]
MSLACQELEKSSVQTPRGVVTLSGPVSSQCLQELAFAEGLRNFRPAQRQKEALVKIAGLPEGMVYVALHDKTAIGYVTFHRPHKYSRWFKHPRILEVGTIEVDPEWRKFKIAKKLLALAFSNPVLEEYIVITTEFCWHWDLARARLDVWQYQKMLAGLFATVGLQRVSTDDPAILEHPANVLMVKFGKYISKADLELFARLRFEKKPGSLPEAEAGGRKADAGIII